jgi:hypothetical protein
MGSVKELKLVEYLMMILKQRLSKCELPPNLIQAKTFQNYLSHLILESIKKFGASTYYIKKVSLRLLIEPQLLLG